MATQFQCPCGRALVADDAHRGMEVKCPACGRALLVPAVPGATAQEAGPAPVAPAAQGMPAAFSSPSAPAPASGAARACPHCGASVPAWGEKCLQCGAFVEGSGPAPMLKICPRCGAQVPSASGACGHCGAPLDAGAPGSPSRAGLPWEHRDTLGIPSAAFQTIKMVLLEPATAFESLRLPPDNGGAFLFFAVFGTLGALGGAGWNAATQSLTKGFLSRIGPPGGGPALPPKMAALQGAVAVFIAPFVAAAQLLIWSGLSHLVLMMTGGGRKDYATTFAVFAYALGSCALFQLLPFCGPLVGLVWILVCLTIGLAHTHRCEGWKAGAAALGPVLFCCCCGGLAFYGILVWAGFIHA